MHRIFFLKVGKVFVLIPALKIFGVVPDANTDVLIQAGAANYPVVNNNVSCRAIRASAGVSVLVKAGIKLTVTGK
jgi:hypothetical protein